MSAHALYSLESYRFSPTRLINSVIQDSIYRQVLHQNDTILPLKT